MGLRRVSGAALPDAGLVVARDKADTLATAAGVRGGAVPSLHSVGTVAPPLGRDLELPLCAVVAL